VNHLSSYRNRFRLRHLILALALGAAGSCGTLGTEAPEIDQISGRAPELAAMIETAREARPVVTERGFLVRSIRVPIQQGVKGWNQASRAVSIEVESDSGVLKVASKRHVAFNARRLGAARLTTSIEGSTLMQRGPGGAAQFALFARPDGVEDLIFQSDASAAAGYELELPIGWTMRSPENFPEIVEIRDSRSRPRMRVAAHVAWDASGTRWPVTARLDGRRVHFEVSDQAEYPITIDPEWQDTGSPARVRARATATVLQNGNILVVGGITGGDEVLNDSAEVTCSTEIYDPLDLTWRLGPDLPIVPDGSGNCPGLMDHAAVPMPDGSVLIVGGANRSATVGANQPAAVGHAFRFDPATETFSQVGSLNEPRVHHTATLLGSGKVLITGGSDRQTPLQEGQGYCPKIDDSKCQRCVGKASAEIYDPATETFTLVPMAVPRACHTATLVDSDRVLLIGGGSSPLDIGFNGDTGAPVADLSLFENGAFRELDTKLNTARFGHVAVLNPGAGQIVVALGRNETEVISPALTGSVMTELLNVGPLLAGTHPPTALPITCTADGGTGGGGGGAEEGGDCPTPRAYASAILSASGKAYIAGGQEASNGQVKPSSAVDEFDFAAGDFIVPAPRQLLSPASKPVLTLLPTGNILLVGQTAPAEVFDDNQWSFISLPPTPALDTSRGHHSVTPLADGRLLVAGGFEANVTLHSTAEIFDPTLNASTATVNMSLPRADHTATLLPGGKVLITGGIIKLPGPGSLPDCPTGPQATCVTSTAEVFDPQTMTFSPTAQPMSNKRANHTAVRLTDGRVLIVGGHGDDQEMLPPSAEIYDPATNTFTPTSPPQFARTLHTASLLPSGNVLIAGGFSQEQFKVPVGEMTSAEIFDLTTDPPTFRAAGSMLVPRGSHTATPLTNGTVLIAGGSAVSAIGEIFDPETETFHATDGAMSSTRLFHAAVMLPSGKVLVSGGAPTAIDEEPRADAEVYDPASEAFTLIEAPVDTEKRWDHEAVLLQDGSVALVAGSTDAITTTTTSSVAILTSNGEPVAPLAAVLSAPDMVEPGSPYQVTGAALTGFWETSSGPYASPTGVPIALWLPLSGTPSFGTFAPWSDGAATWTPPSTAFAGDGFLFAARHGQSSVGVPVSVSLAPNGIACSADAACESGFCSDGVCCNERCHVAGDDDAVCRVCSASLGASADGVCSFAPDGQDPHEDCAQAAQCSQALAVCGGDGECKPCTCSSKLDCADGYICTARGTCERPAEIVVGGCAASGSEPSSTDTRAFLACLALFGAVLARRRRRAPARNLVAFQPVGENVGNLSHRPTDVVDCASSKPLRVARCALRPAGNKDPGVSAL
jgi:hypothetical protein